VFQHATAAADLLDCKQGEGLFVWAGFCPVAQTTPATARRVTDNGIAADVAACITFSVPYIVYQVEVTRVRAGKEDGDARSL